MEAAGDPLPWIKDPDALACNFALGNLVGNTRARSTINGRIHAETYISAVGAIAGYAAQRSLFARFAKTPPVMGRDINHGVSASGQGYWHGVELNYMLASRTKDEWMSCVWPVAANMALNCGLAPGEMRSLDAMLKYVDGTTAKAGEGVSSVPPQHQPHVAGRELLKAVWPMALTCFRGEIRGASQEYGGPVPPRWWSAIAAQAAARPIFEVKDVLAPGIALTLLMELALLCSRFDLDPVRPAQTARAG